MRGPNGRDKNSRRRDGRLRMCVKIKDGMIY